MRGSPSSVSHCAVRSVCAPWSTTISSQSWKVCCSSESIVSRSRSSRFSVGMTTVSWGGSVGTRGELPPCARAPSRSGLSAGTPIADEGHEHDLEIEQRAPILQVPEIALDALAEIGVAAQPLDLRPAGDARRGIVACVVVHDLVLEVLDELRPLRARSDQAHFAAQHVPELRQLIDVPAPQKGADPQPARIVLRRPADFPAGFRIELHAP